MNPEKRKVESQGGKSKKVKTERQGHGLQFEDWIEDTFFESCHIKGPTDHWDFTGVEWKDELPPDTKIFSSLALSVKTCKVGKPIGLGDVMRQFDVGQDFGLIIAFWDKSGSAKKVVSVKTLKVTKEVWHNLFGDITRKQIEDYDKFVKTNVKDAKTSRKEAQQEKENLPDSDITINPKITTNKKTGKISRRVQCSISYNKFWEVLAKSAPIKTSTLWGEDVPKLQ